MVRGIPSDQSVNSNELEADQFEDDGQQVKNAIYDTNEYGKKLAEECAGSVLPDQEVQCSQGCIGNVGGPAVLGGKKSARYFSNQMHNFDGSDLTDQAGLQSSESDYRLGQDSERQTPGRNVIASLYNLPDLLELFREGLSNCDSDRSKDRQTFNSIKPKLPVADHTGKSSDRETLIDNTSERSTETKESVRENINDGRSPRHVDQTTSWLISGPDENGEVTDASANSESRSPSPDTNYSGWGSPPGTGSGSWEPLPDDDSMSDQSNESTDPSDSGSEGGSSNSSDDSFLLEEELPLAEIPLTAKEKRLIGEFYGELEGMREENGREYQKNLYNQSIDCTRNALERVERLVSDYLPQEVRLNSLCDGHEHTISGLVLEVILDILSRVIVITSAASRNFQLGGGACTSALDDPDNVKAVVDIVHKLIVNGGRVKLEPHLYDEHERLCRMIGGDMMSEFIKEREQIRNKLKSAAYEGIVNKDAQGQEGDLVVDIDNCYFYTKYLQDSTIEVTKVVDGLKKVTNDLKIEELNFKYYIFRIGESIVRFEEDKDEKRNYTDVLQGSIEMSFATKAGKISVHLYPNSTETKDGKTENRGIKAEIDEEGKTRFFQLEDEEKKAWAKTVSSKEKALRMS
ncbi:MAG: hypothetical protein LKM43_00510 [Wolbachia endosymbiont of Penenirmus auritus]|nr:hypothetical protein [Wolbachia endosymbiont of Penenirmus auritus]